jgi:SAM-dependent methyltransferase
LPRGNRLSERILTAVERYYSGRFAEYGATPQGVDWNSRESQETRFAQLLRVAEPAGGPFTLNDFGCGYGALVAYLDRNGYEARYRGFDVSETMLDHARRELEAPPRVTFVDRETALDRADFTVASGIFNVRLDISDEDWRAYVEKTLDEIAGISSRGFAFNMLTSYSDPEKMRADLYYGDPRWFFDHCKRRFSRNVALLHDYGLYEFTMIVRLDE